MIEVIRGLQIETKQNGLLTGDPAAQGTDPDQKGFGAGTGKRTGGRVRFLQLSIEAGEAGR